MKFCHFPAYVRTRAAGIPKGRGSPVATSKCLHFGALDRADRRETAPWHTDFGTKSSVLHLVRGVQAPGTHVRSDYPQTRHIGGRPSSHKANLIPQSKRQDTIATMILCLCLFTALRTLVAELVGARPLHLLTQTVLSLKSPTGAFIASQTLIFRRKQIIRTYLLPETSSDYFCLVRVARIELTAS